MTNFRLAIMMTVLAALAMAGLSGCGDTSAESPESFLPPAPAATHELTWEKYDGTGDPARAVFVLDGRRLGAGAAGLEKLRQEIARLPRGTQVAIVPYYGDPGGDARRVYPFNVAEVQRWADAHGVLLVVPNAA
jgi:hypothetical protein